MIHVPLRHSLLSDTIQEAQCLKDGKAAAQCKTKRQTCEFENGTGKAQIRINQDNLSKDIVTNFFQVGTPACDGLEKLEGQDKPFICDVREEIPGSEGAILFTPSDKPSKFIEDNATGHTLIGEKLKKGLIGECFKTTVVDNGDSTFTAGNLTTFSRSFALQLGCLFDVHITTQYPIYFFSPSFLSDIYGRLSPALLSLYLDAVSDAD
jgi:hypothetical protein